MLRSQRNRGLSGQTTEPRVEIQIEVSFENKIDSIISTVETLHPVEVAIIPARAEDQEEGFQRIS